MSVLDYYIECKYDMVTSCHRNTSKHYWSFVRGIRRCPKGIWCNNNVIMTSKLRRFDVIMTLLLRRESAGWPVNSSHKSPAMRSSNVFFDYRLNRLLSKQSNFQWFERRWREYGIVVTCKTSVSIQTLEYLELSHVILTGFDGGSHRRKVRRTIFDECSINTSQLWRDPHPLSF